MSDEEKTAAIDTLVSLGFSEEDAKKAIEKFGSVEEAVNQSMDD